MKPGLVVAVVGATGLVGREFVPLLEKSSLPVEILHLFSSGKYAAAISFRKKKLKPVKINPKILFSCDLVFFVSSDEISLKWAPALAKKGVWVIDDSSAFRLDPSVPLVIPEVNADALSSSKKLIAGPNCTITGLAVAGHKLHREIGVNAARLASYQSVSGAGKAALREFFSQTKASLKHLNGEGGAPVFPAPKTRVSPKPIAFNVIPQVGNFDAQGFSSEERKVTGELRKLWKNPKLPVSATTVRVPVVRSHSLAVWLTLSKSLPLYKVRRILKNTPGVVLEKNTSYQTPLSWAGRGKVSVSRLRQGAFPHEICLWIVSDNLLKGAALNSVQIAEHLWRRGWLKPQRS